jgi:hypothetical protein
MPQPCSADLRERVLVACKRGDGGQVEIACRFQVCPARGSPALGSLKTSSEAHSHPPKCLAQ